MSGNKQAQKDEAVKCFKCGKGKMTRQTADITGDVNGEQITVQCECFMCNRL